MVAIAVDRYICICHPLRQATLATGRRARFVVAFLTLVATTLGVCTALMFGVNHRIDIPRKTIPTPLEQPRYSSVATDNDDPHLTSGVNQATSSPGRHFENVSTTTMIEKIWNCTGAKQASRWALHACGEDQRAIDSVALTTEDPDDYYADEHPVLNTGYCGATDLIVGETYEQNFLKIHSTMYPLCLLAIIVLYGLIYRSVLVRRARRQRLRSPALPRQPSVSGERRSQKRWTIARLSPLSSSLREQRRRCTNSVSEVVEPTTATDGPATSAASPAAHANNGRSPDSKDDIELVPPGSTVDVSASNNARHKSVSIVRMLRHKPRVFKESVRSMYSGGCSSQNRTLLVANLRTAAMLLVVTVVFVVCYTPAFLMSLRVIPYQMMSFHLYFVNSVANPVVYSFMNRYFRQELASIVCRPVYGYYSANEI